MAAGKFRLCIEQGATFAKSLLLKANDAPIDLAGYDGRMQVRDEYDSPVAVMDLTVGNGGVVIEPGGETGRVDLVLDAAATALLPAPFSGFYDVELISPVSVVSRILEGRVRIKPEVTK